MSPRPRLCAALALALVACVALLPAVPAPAAKRCAAKKEQRGCRLPDGATFETRSSDQLKPAMLQVFRTASVARGIVPVTCQGSGSPGGNAGFPVGEKLNLPGRPRVGKTYRSRWTFDEVSPDGRTRSVGDYAVRAKIVSAKRVKLTLSYDLESRAAD